MPSIELAEEDLLDVEPLPPPSSRSSVPPPVPKRSLAETVRVVLNRTERADGLWQVANACAVALAEALAAGAVLVHSHDGQRGEIRTIGAFGPKQDDLLGGAASADDDFVASSVLANAKPLILRFDGELPRIAPERLRSVGAERSLVAVPVMHGGACVAVIEVIDAEAALVGRVPEACAPVCERLSELLGARVVAA